MARLQPEQAEHFRAMPMPSFEATPAVPGPPLAERRVALLSTAGLHRRSDPAFALMSADYRVIPGDVDPNDLLMSHISVNFDRSGFEQDWNVVFPLERLHELADRGEIGSVAGYHYAVMGATDPAQMEASARELAGLLHADHVDALLLVPV